MKALSDKTIDTFEEVALEGAKQLRAFFAYQGENPQYHHRAKLGAAAVSAYSRIRASETNRMAVELQAKRSNVGSE